MAATSETRAPKWFGSFDLRYDQNDYASIRKDVQQGATAIGSNLWGLIFAIMIASIGLNVGSTAVIIGAMLISPLMGPIVGMGFGAGVNDGRLIRRSAKNLSVMVAISLVAATVYFALSPLKEPNQEILARTTPTLWDVLIAFFGGAAGIVALTRKGVSNVIPGVAIATALMPPLCTVGYGIANAAWEVAAGALYLFTINGVFIAFATLLFVRVMRLPVVTEIDGKSVSRQRAIIAGVIVLMALPSTYLAWNLVRAEQFSAAAKRITSELTNSPDIILLARDVDARSFRVTLTLAGKPLPDLGTWAASEIRRAGFPQATVDVLFAGTEQPDVGSLRESLQAAVHSNTIEALSAATARVQSLQAEFDELAEKEAIRDQLLKELRSQFPDAHRIEITTGFIWRNGDNQKQPFLRVHMTAEADVTSAERSRWIAAWQARFPSYRVEIDVQPPTVHSGETEANVAEGAPTRSGDD